MCNFLNDLTVSSLTKEQSVSSKRNLTEPEILISFENNKSSGSDGLTKEFHSNIWDDITETFMKSLKKSK